MSDTEQSVTDFKRVPIFWFCQMSFYFSFNRIIGSVWAAKLSLILADSCDSSMLFLSGILLCEETLLLHISQTWFWNCSLISLGSWVKARPRSITWRSPGNTIRLFFMSSLFVQMRMGEFASRARLGELAERQMLFRDSFPSCSLLAFPGMLRFALWL